MTGFWFCYGCLIIGILYYVSYDVFVGELNEAVVELEPTEMDLLQGENVTFVSDNSTDDKTLEHTGPLVDIFDFCPFKPPDPWHESILKYMDDKYGFMKDCKPNETLASVTDLVNGTVVKKKGKEKFTCKGRCVEYAGDNKYDLSNWSNIEEKSFSCDFVETECKLGNVVNRYIHMQVAEKLSRPPDTLNPQKNPSVLLLVIDSVASTQIIRALPRTINFLMHGLEAVEFRRLNKVGSNSRPNAFPLLLGRTTEAIVKKVMNVPTIEPDLSYNDYCNRYLDDIPYIPLEYKKAGYQMFGAEDYTASILNYPNCKGTKERQFEHSYRPLHSRLRDDKELKNIHLSGACRLLHSIMLDYLSKFVKANKGWPKFALTWLVDIAHDNTKHLYRGDYELYSFFLNNRHDLNNTFVFFLGDHGPRFGSEAGTKFGISEQRNPFLYVVVPEHLRGGRIHQQLIANSQELVTHHDLHATFKDILYNQPDSKFNDTTFKRSESNPRGSSLLRKFELGIRRTCKTLPIPFQYCTCQYKKENVSDIELLSELGKFAVQKLAGILRENNVESKCAKIEIGNEVAAEKYVVPNAKHRLLYNLFDVTFNVAEPALGKFRIPVRMKKGEFELAGDQFDRLDKYGKNGDCMKQDILRPICTCNRG